MLEEKLLLQKQPFTKPIHATQQKEEGINIISFIIFL
jgi:hypothetical protein